MKANELMIGDWVRCTDPKPFRITDIETECGTPHFIVNNTDRLGINGGNLRPIPLTGEILEKNGFKARGGYWECRNNYCSIKLYIAPKIEIEGELFDEPPILLKVDGATFNLNIIVVYVHELQHALRLCGIEIEIKL